MRAARRRPGALAALLVLAGCATAGAGVRASAPAQVGPPVRRLGLIPFAADDAAGAALVGPALGEALAARQGASLVLVPSADAAVALLHEGQRQGRLPADAVLGVSARHGVDAVLVGRLTRYRPHAPPAAALEVALVSAVTGDVVWAATGVVDLGDPGTRQAAEGGLLGALVRSVPEANVAGLVDPQEAFLIRQSPERFARFLAEAFVATAPSAP